MPQVSAPSVEASQADLLARQHAQFERDGMLVVENALSPEAVARIREACDRIVAAGEARGRWIGKPVSARRRVEYRGLFSLDEAFLELLAPKAVFPVLVKVLGPNLHMMSSQLLYAHPRQEPRPYHGGW